MNPELPFPGFHDLIQVPLADSDPRSFSMIKRLLIELKPDQTPPFTLLMQRLTGVVVDNAEAVNRWKRILAHKAELQLKLGRTVGIRVAAIDYLECRSPEESALIVPGPESNRVAPSSGESMEALYIQGGYHLEKLREEILRAKRYRHALSVILLDIDNFGAISLALGRKNSDKVLTTIVRIIKRIIRTVDILSRLSSDRFLLILPNTNGREARELAERIRVQIFERTGRLSIVNEGLTVTLSVGQCSQEDTSADFIRRLENVLEEGRNRNGNTVFSLS